MIPMDLPEPDADALAHSARLQQAITALIEAEGGTIAFSRFMELALYAPGLGYYSAGASKFGAEGDFITAPELGPLFAHCVAQAIAPVLRAIGDQAEVLELGGGSGAFAVDALRALDAANVLPRRYAILEPSADLRERQRDRLAVNLSPTQFARVEWLDRLPESDWRGVLFANEVLDALPTTRFEWREGEVWEQCVAVEEGRFVWQSRPADGLVGGAVRHLRRYLDAPQWEDGYLSECLPQLPYWLDAVCGSLAQGLALFVDYGYPRREFYLPERRTGTLSCFYRHRTHDQPFLWPGLQDITASVDFTALAEAGRHAGLDLAGYTSQAAFLLQHGLERHAQQDPQDAVASHRRALEAKRLILPSEMGERFQVMGLSRGMDCEALFAMGDQCHRL